MTPDKCAARSKSTTFLNGRLLSLCNKSTFSVDIVYVILESIMTVSPTPFRTVFFCVCSKCSLKCYNIYRLHHRSIISPLEHWTASYSCGTDTMQLYNSFFIRRVLFSYMVWLPLENGTRVKMTHYFEENLDFDENPISFTRYHSTIYSWPESMNTHSLYDSQSNYINSSQSRRICELRTL